MNIGDTLSSWGSSLSSAASSFGSTCKDYGLQAVEKGKMGYNRSVELIKNNPNTALITTLAVAAVAVGTVYCLSGSNSTPPSGTGAEELG